MSKISRVAAGGLVVLTLVGLAACGTTTAAGSGAVAPTTPTVTTTAHETATVHAPPSTVTSTAVVDNVPYETCLLDAMTQLDSAYSQMNDYSRQLLISSSSILNGDLTTGNMTLEGAGHIQDDAITTYHQAYDTLDGCSAYL